MTENNHMEGTDEGQGIRVAAGRTLRTTSVYDTYWRFACRRQQVFTRRVAGDEPPWTADPIIAQHRFTNAYRATDRVSQYLIRHVIYDGPAEAREVFFRTLLFKFFNRIDTWELLLERLGERPTWEDFDVDRYAQIFDRAMGKGRRLYSAAYIMPTPPFGERRKHANHLRLLQYMMQGDAWKRTLDSRSLKQVYETLLGYPSLGPFLAFQFTIDLNYSELIDFPESDFVVAGPGAIRGIQKCFTDTSGLTAADVIRVMADRADHEFASRDLEFPKLGGRRPLQLIDCQNLFCETDKYARVAHPEFSVGSGRTRIKQKFTAKPRPIPQFYPPKWHLTPQHEPVPPREPDQTNKQLAFSLAVG